jgi:hypothetical protein
MFIYKEISNEGVNGAYFAEELRWLRSKTVLKTVRIKLNSVGGDVIHAQVLFQLMTLRKRRYYWNIRERTSLLRLVILAYNEASNRYRKRLRAFNGSHGVSLKTKNVSENDLNSKPI